MLRPSIWPLVGLLLPTLVLAVLAAVALVRDWRAARREAVTTANQLAATTAARILNTIEVPQTGGTEPSSRGISRGETDRIEIGPSNQLIAPPPPAWPPEPQPLVGRLSPDKRAQWEAARAALTAGDAVAAGGAYEEFLGLRTRSDPHAEEAIGRDEARYRPLACLSRLDETHSGWLAVRQVSMSSPQQDTAATPGRSYVFVPEEVLRTNLQAVLIAEDRDRHYALQLEMAGRRIAVASRASGRDAVEILARTTRITGSGVPMMIAASLVDPSAFYTRQRQRLRLFTGILIAALVAAAVSVAATGRALVRQHEISLQKSNFVSAVSHELRAPLGSIRLLAEGLERGTISGEARRQEYFHLIGQETRQLASLVENVLDFSRIEQGRKQYDLVPTDMVALVRGSVALAEPMPLHARGPDRSPLATRRRRHRFRAPDGDASRPRPPPDRQGIRDAAIAGRGGRPTGVARTISRRVTRLQRSLHATARECCLPCSGQDFYDRACTGRVAPNLCRLSLYGSLSFTITGISPAGRTALWAANEAHEGLADRKKGRRASTAWRVQAPTLRSVLPDEGSAPKKLCVLPRPPRASRLLAHQLHFHGVFAALQPLCLGLDKDLAIP
jgi:signal transduction histidine kinase